MVQIINTSGFVDIYSKDSIPVVKEELSSSIEDSITSEQVVSTTCYNL